MSMRVHVWLHGVAGVSHQADRYYKDGAFDSCAAQRKDLMTCAWLARATPAEKKVRAGYEEDARA
ncbi:DUF3128 domain-containing protein [archaeon]|nr:MAG: DUF3128 domain-containing protein [archaeon]